MSRFFLPYDIYERHKKIAEMLGSVDSVLDVGGELDQLAKFSNVKKIVVANLENSQEKSDVIIKKGNLPFKSNSFSAVCAIDVLEHIPKAQREEFVKDLFKVCRKKVVLSFPIGTESHIKYEKKMLDRLESNGKDVTYLKEHVKFGLPTPKELKLLTKNKKNKVIYSGNLLVNNILFKIFIFDPQIKIVRKLVYFSKLLFNFLTNGMLYLLLSKKKLSSSVVRAYVIFEK